MLSARPAVWTSLLACALLAIGTLTLVHATESASAAGAVCATSSPAMKTRGVLSGPVAKRMRAALAKCPQHRGAGLSADQAPDPAPPPCAPMLAAAVGSEMNEGIFRSELSLRSTGTVRAVMLFMDFPDLAASESTSVLYNRLASNSVRWLAEVSGGRMTLQVTPVHRWYRARQGFRAFGLGDGLTFDEQRDYIRAAVEAADPDVDFSPYDIVFVVGARGTDLERSPAFHAFRGSGVAADGNELRYGSTFGEDVRGPDPLYGSHVLLHETGHLIGLPDLYDVPNARYWTLLRFAGGWDMMSWNTPGAHFLAWHKWKLGWLDPSQLTCLDAPGEVTTTIAPAAAPGGLKAVVVPTGPATAFVVEARRRIRQDSRLCEDGVLVYTVDATVASGYGPIRVRPAQGGNHMDSINSCGPLYNAPFDAARGEVARFSDEGAGIAVHVLKGGPAGYRVRVSRTSTPAVGATSIQLLLTPSDYQRPDEG